MAKFARRSVASNPSLLTSINSSWSFSSSSTLSPISSTTKIIPSFSSHNKAKFGENSYHQKRSSSISSSNNINKNLPSSLLPATLDPLRTTNNQLTTRTISTNYNRNGGTTAAGNQNSSIHRNDSKFYNNNYNTNTTLSSTNTTSTGQNYNRNNNSLSSAADLLAAEREKVRMEFYATYDVMTGVRIAATLGGFFGLMVFLVVYKSRGHSDDTLKVLKDPKIAAVAAACMQEEEEREIQEAIEATGLSIYPDEYEHMMFRRQRMLSLGNVSAPPILHRYRFSSIGGGPYSSLLESGRRYSYSGGRRRSGSESSRVLGNYHMGSSFGTDDYFIETDDELESESENNKDKENDSVHTQGFLGVPPAGQESRRSSAMTCCSTESSYLERRCSALNLGLMELPTTTERRISSVSRRSSADIWDYYYPDIQIIQATPKQSPCLSERNVHDRTNFISTTSTSTTTTTTPPSTTMKTSTIKNSSIIKSSTMTKHPRTTTTTTTTTTATTSTIPTTTSTSTITNGSTSYYGQYNKIFPKSDDFYRCHHDSFIEKRKICHTLSADSNIKINRKYDDTNELKLIVERKISDPSSIMNNNNINSNYNNNNNLNSNNNYNNNSYNNLYTSSYDSLKLLRNHENDDVVKRAPLASLSSFKISSIDYQDSDLKSLGSDSVFVESYADTDNDMEQFSTDSDELSGSLCDDDNDDYDVNNEAIGLQLQSLPSVSLQSQTLSSHLKLHKQKQQQQHPIRKTSSILIKPQQHQQQKHGDYSRQQQQQQHISTKSEPCSIKIDENRYRKHQTNYNSKRIRATLERHRTQSASSNDRILLISSSQQSSQEQPSTSSLEHHLPSTSDYYNQRELPSASSSNIYHHHHHYPHPYPHHSPSTTLQQQLPLSAATGSFKTASNKSDEALKGHGTLGRRTNGGGEIGGVLGGGGGGTSTGTTTSSCSSSQKTEIYRPSLIPVIKSGSGSSSGIIKRTSSFSYDNNKDSFSNRSGISNKRYYSSNRKHHHHQPQHQVNDNNDDDNDDVDDDQSKLSTTSSNNSNNECVEVNVIIENRPTITTTNIISSSSSPSVILELPVITTTTSQTLPHLSQFKDDNDDDDDNDDPPRDPSLPGTSRKWSKETLF